MKKIISVLLSAVILFAVTAGLDYSALALDTSSGVDVSEFNEDADYSYIKSSDNSFVMIRLGYYNHLDKYFWSNVEKAHNEGIDFGVYLFSEAYNADEANIEAQFVIDTLSQLGEYSQYFKLPVAYDLESSRIVNKGEEFGNCGKAEVTKNMTVFCDKIRSAGYTPMVYSNLNWFTNYIDLNTVVNNNYKIWYAYHNSTDNMPDLSTKKEIGNTGVKADIWQYYAPAMAAPTAFDKNVIYYSIDEQVTLSETKYSYDGQIHFPTVTVKDNNGNILTEDKDYSVEYINKESVNPGVYGVKVNMFNDYFSRDVYTYSIAPSTTVLKSLTPTAYGFKVNWTKVDETTGYQIQYSTKSDFSGSALVYGGPTDTLTNTITGRACGAKYYVRVRTYKTFSDGTRVWGDWSNSMSVTTPAKPRATTMNVSSAVNGFKISWSKVVETTGYQIEYSTRSDFKGSALVYGGATNTLSKTITGRAAGTKYYVRVRTYKTLADGTRLWGSWSKAQAVTTKVAQSSVKSVSGVSRGFKTTWNKIGGVTGYQIQYSTRKDFKGAATVYAGDKNATAKTITGRAKNTTYYIRVRGYKNNGNGNYVWGAWSSAKAVKTK